MPISNDLMERSGDVKREIVEFAMHSQYERAFRRASDEYFGRNPPMDEADIANALDWFILQWRLPDGRTLLEHYVDAHPDMPDEERALLLSWHDVVEGIFEVKKRDGDALIAVNIIDEMTYRLRSNAGPDVFRQMPRGTHIAARIVPAGDEWLLSGVTSLLSHIPRDEIYLSANELAMLRPETVFRNPEKLERAWELQRQERQLFIEFFGDDLVIIPGHEIDERMQAYLEFRQYEARDEEGKTAADRARQLYGVEPPKIDAPLPDDFRRAETIGVICDDIEGMNYYVNFGQVAEVFANPALASERRGRQIVLRYLQDESVSPFVFRRLAERDPARGSEVFQHVLKQPGFSWERDGEAVLRQYKAEFFDQPIWPSTVPLTEEQSRRQMAAAEQTRTKPNFRPARKGKKRK